MLFSQVLGTHIEPMQADDGSAPLLVSVNEISSNTLKSDEHLEREEAVLTQLTLGVIIAASDSNLKETAVPFLEGLVRHAALLILHTPFPLSVSWPNTQRAARPRAIVDALISAVGSAFRPEQGEVAMAMLCLLLETTQLAGGRSPVALASYFTCRAAPYLAYCAATLLTAPTLLDNAKSCEQLNARTRCRADTIAVHTAMCARVQCFAPIAAE